MNQNYLGEFQGTGDPFTEEIWEVKCYGIIRNDSSSYTSQEIKRKI